jgi:hypothetical protein
MVFDHIKSNVIVLHTLQKRQDLIVLGRLVRGYELQLVQLH